MDKIKLNTAEGQAAMKAVPLGTQIILHGEIVMGKYMTKALAGEDLKKDCDFMMSRGVRQPNRNERYRFNITNVQLITEGRQTLNAAEQYVWQSVYADKEGRPTKVVEMGNKEFIDNKISSIKITSTINRNKLDINKLNKEQRRQTIHKYFPQNYHDSYKKCISSIDEIKDDEIIASGDQDNDIEMLKEAGVRICVGQNSANLALVANYHAKSVDSDELVNIIEGLI